MDSAINQIAGGKTLDYHKVLVENAKLVGDVMTLRATVAEQQKRIDDMNSLCAFNERTMDEMLARLAAAQAQIKVLREALEDLKIYAQDTGQPLYIYRRITDALSTPHDDSALRELLKAERERCAKVCEEEAADPHNVPAAIVARRCAESIRAMEDQR